MASSASVASRTRWPPRCGLEVASPKRWPPTSGFVVTAIPLLLVCLAVLHHMRILHGVPLVVRSCAGQQLRGRRAHPGRVSTPQFHPLARGTVRGCREESELADAPTEPGARESHVGASSTTRPFAYLDDGDDKDDGKHHDHRGNLEVRGDIVARSRAHRSAFAVRGQGQGPRRVGADGPSRSERRDARTQGKSAVAAGPTLLRSCPADVAQVKWSHRPQRPRREGDPPHGTEPLAHRPPCILVLIWVIWDGDGDVGCRGSA